MSMTRKDYRIVAQALLDTKPSIMSTGMRFEEMTQSELSEVAHWQRTVHVMTFRLATANANFDAERFRTACGA